ncbi:MmcQ/YjbR family DNA-binding protein [Ruminococcaceae bacterium OttesenSCG-928-I18]|nr:MmcQ/YjbR family DNA-binding protein [Ruminococcaceae bacterium OttesenSCG-928-I18]
MEKRELLALCLSQPGAYEDYPFRDSGWAVARHGPKGKIFAFVFERQGRLCINLKCEPMRADFYRHVYSDVGEGYHLNHRHWNTVKLCGDVPLGELREMIHHSYELTAPKPREANCNQMELEKKCE